MSNWTVTINKEEYEFDMFSEAVRMMKTAIKQHICINTDVFNTEASEVARFPYTKICEN